MLILTLSMCPPALRGDLTKWLMEIDTGVYVGNVSARVRDELWQRVCENAKQGRATIVFSANNEQRMDFRVHNSNWQPVDFDGLKLMLRPAPGYSNNPVEVKSMYSNAAKIHMAHVKARRPRRRVPILERYAVVDLETTGLSPIHDEIIEIGALIIRSGQIESEYHAYVKPSRDITRTIEQLTGLTNDLLKQSGRPLEEIIISFIKFIGDLPVITHNAKFDYDFLRAACAVNDIPLFSNPSIDTCELARRTLKDAPNYKLHTLVEYLHLDAKAKHRSIADCLATKQLYEKLNEMEV